MGIVRRVVDFNNFQLSEESLKRMAALKDRPIDFSDIPELTPEEIAEIRAQRKDDQKKQMFSLRLQKGTIKGWRRTIGEGYTTVMAKLLEKALRHPDWLKECL
jgi:hypothetical protein